MHSVRELIDKEQSARGAMSVLLLRKFKLRVCNYLRNLLPGAMNQKVPAPLLTFCEFLKAETGDALIGPAGRFLMLKLIPHLHVRHEIRLPSKHDRLQIFQRYMALLREAADPSLFAQAIPACLACDSDNASSCSDADAEAGISQSASSARSKRAVHQSEC